MVYTSQCCTNVCANVRSSLSLHALLYDLLIFVQCVCVHVVRDMVDMIHRVERVS